MNISWLKKKHFVTFDYHKQLFTRFTDDIQILVLYNKYGKFPPVFIKANV